MAQDVRSTNLPTTRRGFIAGVAALAAIGPVGRAWAASLDHGAFDAVLGAVVQPAADGINRVDYRTLQARHLGALRGYIADLEGVAPQALGRDQAMAFWINLYNAVTLAVVAEHYPVASIRDIDLGGNGLFGRGPWKAKLAMVAGRALSLDDIEHGILRPQFGDARIHYAVNCASLSCPNLQRQAYDGVTLEAMLEAGARSYVNHPRGVAVEGSTVRASKIYDWYGKDFGGTTGLKKHWRRYAGAELADRLAKADNRPVFHYDWSLNDVR